MPLSESAERFLKYDYTETKDLCKHFLTVVIAVLVFSLTLAEKIVAFATATQKAKIFLFFAWAAMIASVVACGVGLCYNSLAGGDAANGGNNYQSKARIAYLWLGASELTHGTRWTSPHVIEYTWSWTYRRHHGRKRTLNSIHGPPHLITPLLLQIRTVSPPR